MAKLALTASEAASEPLHDKLRADESLIRETRICFKQETQIQSATTLLLLGLQGRRIRRAVPSRSSCLASRLPPSSCATSPRFPPCGQVAAVLRKLNHPPANRTRLRNLHVGIRQFCPDARKDGPLSSLVDRSPPITLSTFFETYLRPHDIDNQRRDMDSQPPRIDSMEPDKSAIKFSKSYPLEFVYVKTLFLQKQYRQCISTCRQILDAEHDDQAGHPLEQTFMRLYIALAHDELARSMHNFSSAKLSAFGQAESLHEEAAAAIPTIDDCYKILLGNHSAGSSQEQEHSQSDSSLPQSTSQSTLNSDVFRRPPSPSPFLSPPTQPNTSLPSITSPESPRPEIEDGFESDDDSGALLTPQRVQRLPSTYSSMSLLEPQKQAHGLLRPIRPGSVAKPYQAPPKFSPSGKQFRSRLPRLNTGSSLGSPQKTPLRQSSPVRKQLRSPDEEWSPVESTTSPVSPLGSAYVASDDMTISPISASTPVTDHAEADFDTTPARSITEMAAASPLVRHVIALRGQIETHINLLGEARQRTIAAQADRATKNCMRKVPASRANKLSSGVPQSRSFWLFTPQDFKVLEKQKRIEDGRQRMWAKPRFDPSRYQGLAEKALAEL